MIRLSIVIPVFNSDQTIGTVCRLLMETLHGRYTVDIVLVNDFSTDSSDAVCRALQREYPEIITYVKLARNYGEHNAVLAGLRHARGEYAVIMDDDLQNPPEEVSKLLDEIRKGYDVVYSSYAEKKDSWHRNLASRLNGFMAQAALGKPADLYLSSFKVVNRFLIDEIIKYQGPNPYLDAIILRTTGSIGTVQVKHHRRKFKESQYTFRKLFSLWAAMIVNYSLIPLRMIGFLGFVMTVIGVYYGGRAFVTLLLPGGHAPSEYQRLTAATFFFRGFQLLATSVVGEYVGRTYLLLNRDPPYVIRDIVPASPAGDDREARPGAGT
jgi:undecaprenyl-phosphate 4-deoxy-4-formamido-L-arabinose transferase